MKSRDKPRFRLDVLRRTMASLAAASGMRPDRAAALATHLLWFDAAGALAFGTASLPDLLDRISRGEIDPKSEGRVGQERAAAAVLDGQNGVPALILSRAAGIATEKAREYGVGLVRVKGIGPAGPAAPIVVEMAIGPVIGLALGPGGEWSAAMPAAEGLPLLEDSTLGAESGLRARIVPWSPLTAPGGWLVQAVAVTAMESLAGLHERVAESARSVPEAPGTLRPDVLEARRREARERGVSLDGVTRSALKSWAERLGVPDLLKG